MFATDATPPPPDTHVFSWVTVPQIETPGLKALLLSSQSSLLLTYPEVPGTNLGRSARDCRSRRRHSPGTEWWGRCIRYKGPNRWWSCRCWPRKSDCRPCTCPLAGTTESFLRCTGSRSFPGYQASRCSHCPRTMCSCGAWTDGAATGAPTAGRLVAAGRAGLTAGLAYSHSVVAGVLLASAGLADGACAVGGLLVVGRAVAVVIQGRCAVSRFRLAGGAARARRCRQSQPPRL